MGVRLCLRALALIVIRGLHNFAQQVDVEVLILLLHVVVVPVRDIRRSFLYLMLILSTLTTPTPPAEAPRQSTTCRATAADSPSSGSRAGCEDNTAFPSRRNRVLTNRVCAPKHVNPAGASRRGGCLSLG